MNIAVDGNEANVTMRVGVSTYTYELLSYFKRHSGADSRFTVFLREPPGADMPRESEYFVYRIVPGKFAWSQIFLPLHLYIGKMFGRRYDVFFSPAHYIPRFCPFKTVVTIHDLSYLYFPNEFLKKDLYQLTNWTRYAVEKSAKCIAVSKTTKKDVLKEYKLVTDKVTVIYNGYSSSPPGKTEKKEKNDPYFLYVGTIQPRKNLKLLIGAFAEVVKRHPDYKLILAGKMGWLSNDIAPYVRSLHLDGSVLFPGYVSVEEKNTLYGNAVAFVMPSLYEGFGIPLLEAMAHKCPVISSFKSSLPEIGGEACLYFDPEDRTDLAEKMELVATDRKMKSDLVSKGLARVKLFSWEKTGEETLQLLRSVE